MECKLKWVRVSSLAFQKGHWCGSSTEYSKCSVSLEARRMLWRSYVYHPQESLAASATLTGTDDCSDEDPRQLYNRICREYPAFGYSCSSLKKYTQEILPFPAC